MLVDSAFELHDALFDALFVFHLFDRDLVRRFLRPSIFKRLFRVPFLENINNVLFLGAWKSEGVKVT